MHESDKSDPLLPEPPEFPPGDDPDVNHSQLVRETMEHFKRALKARDELHIRVAGRVTQMIRSLMVGVAIMISALFLVVSLFGRHVGHMLETVDTMNRHFTTMTEDMNEMNRLVRSMEKSVAAMPLIVPEVERMQADVGRMRAHIDTMSGRMDGISGNMVLMGDDIERMTVTFGAMEHNVRGIGADVNQLSRPMRSFNSFFPFY